MTNARSRRVGNINHLTGKSIVFTPEDNYFFSKRYVLHIIHLERNQT